MKIATSTYVGVASEELPEKGTPVVPAFPFGEGVGQFIDITTFKFCPRATVTADVINKDDVTDIIAVMTKYYSGMPEHTISGIINQFISVLDKIDTGTDITVSGDSDSITVINAMTKMIISKINIKL